MISHRYRFKSDNLRNSYIHGIIDYQSYLASLEDIKREELTSVVFDFRQREMEEEIFAFEVQQMHSAEQEINLRKEEAEAVLLQVEREKTKQMEAMSKLKEEEKKAQPVLLEEKLLKARTEFYEKESRFIVNRYTNDARRFRKKHDRMQLAVIMCSALATSTTGATIFIGTTNISTGLKITAALLSLIVTIASGSIAYFKYKERGNDAQKAADKIEDDYNALKLGTGRYRGITTEEALSMFAEDTNNTVSEHKKKQQLLDQPPDGKHVLHHA